MVTVDDPSNDGTPTWTWTSGGGGNGTYRCKLDDNDLTTGATEQTVTAFTPASNLTNATHTLYVQERDAAGNWSATGSAGTFVDTEAPDIQEFWVTNSLTQECHYMVGSTVDIYIYPYENGSGMDQMRFQNAGGSWSTWETYSNNKDDWDIMDYSYGTKTVNGQFTDNAGNVGTATFTVQKDDSYEACKGDDTMATAWEYTSLLDDSNHYLNSSGAYHVTGDSLTDYDFIEVTVDYGLGGTVIAEMTGGSGALDLMIYNSDGSTHEVGADYGGGAWAQAAYLTNCDSPYVDKDLLHPGLPRLLPQLWFDVYRRLRGQQRRLHVGRRPPSQPRSFLPYTRP